MTTLDLEDDAIDHVADNPRQENDEGIDHALDQRQRNHVAIGDVANLVPEHRLGLVLGHRLQQAGTDGHQGVIARHAGGKCIHVGRVVNRDLRHTDAGSVRLPAHGGKQPALGRVARRFDHLRTGKPLGGPFRDCQRNKRSAETEYRREQQQAVDIEADTLLVQESFEPQQAQRDAQYQHDGQVGCEKQKDAFHLNSR